MITISSFTQFWGTSELTQSHFLATRNILLPVNFLLSAEVTGDQTYCSGRTPSETIMGE